MRRLIFFLPLFLIAGCRRNDQIQTYRVSKEEQPAMPMASGMPMSGDQEGAGQSSNLPPDHPDISGGMGSGAGGDMQAMGAGMAPAASSKEIEWKVPSGWTAQAPSSMRVGSFLFKGKNGQNADVSVVPLSGQAGGDLANINRWRGQINLEPISEADLPHNSETIQPGGRKMLWVDFTSREPLVESRYKKRLMAAAYTRGERTWFFKMTGEESVVGAAKPSFLQFLKSLRFHDE